MPIQVPSFFRFRAGRALICPIFVTAILFDSPVDAAAPPIGFSSYFGGSEAETINDMAIDAAGNVYVVGTTGGSSDFPQVNAHQSTDPEDPDYRVFDVGQTNCFVASFAPDGSIRFSTYLGGSLAEEGLAIALDESANVYVAGSTQSYRFGNAAFPTTEGAFKTDFNAFECAFVASYSSTGALRYSTVYDTFGGTDSKAVAIHANADGSATTLLRLGGQWRLVTFSPGGSSVLETIELGVGSYSDMAKGIDGSIHLVGTNLPIASTSNSFSLGMSGSFFAASYQLRLETGEIVYAAHWSADSAGEVAVDDDGRAVVVGGVEPTTLTPSHISTSYPYYGFPLKNAFQPTYGGGDSDAYVIVIDPSETGDASLVASSFLGGPESDVARSVATDVLGRIFVVGNTLSEEFPVVDGFPAFTPPPALENGFLAQLNASGTGVIFSSLVGGAQADRATSVAVELFGDFIAVGGRTESNDFHEVNALQDAKGLADAFLVFSDTAIVLESLIVNSVNDVDDGSCDSAHCSMREAIKAANQRADRPTISFDIPGEATPIIQPSSPLPAISAPVVIDGRTQAGGWVVLDGATHSDTLDGILITGTNDVELRGLVVQNFEVDGIRISGGSGHRLAGLRVGTTLDGMSAAKNKSAGISLDGVSGSALGGVEEGDALLVSGNGAAGIVIEDGGGNTIDNVIVGLDAEGQVALANGGVGIHFLNTVGNSLGSSSLGAKRNLVSGNASDGILIEGQFSFDNAVYRSFIGLAADGATVRKNGLGLTPAGVRVKGATGSLIGEESKGNVISGNGGFGIRLEGSSSHTIARGNFIGTNSQGETLSESDQLVGVSISSSSENLIGGEADTPGTGEGNVISGNPNSGVEIFGALSQGNRVSGNVIGLTASGTATLANGTGVLVNSPDTVIGGALSKLGNIISGNRSYGISSESSQSLRLRIESNWIGVGPLGDESFGNEQSGVFLLSASDGLRIGGDASAPGQAPGNVISGNGTNGIHVHLGPNFAGPFLIAGNIIGLGADGLSTVGTQEIGIKTAESNERDFVIRGNLVSGNVGTGISVGGSKDVRRTRALVLEGNVIGLGLGGAKRGNAFGLAVASNSSAHLLSGEDNVISGNALGGVVVADGSVALFRQSIYDNGGAELLLPDAGPEIVGLWRQPVFPGVDLPEGMMIASRFIGSLLDSATIEVFHSEGCDANGVGQGQTWLAAGRKVGFTPLVTSFLSGVPETGYLSARSLVHRRFPSTSIWVGVELPRYSRLYSTQFSDCVGTRTFLEDTDGDGVPDELEADLDMNKDGVIDGLEKRVASFLSPDFEGAIGVSVESGEQALSVIGYSYLLELEKPPVRAAAPSGYLHIGVGPEGAQVNSERAGPLAEGDAEIVVYLPEGQRIDSVWAHVPGAESGQRWLDISELVTVSDGQIRFVMVDGASWDLEEAAGSVSATIVALRHVDGIEVTSWGFDRNGRLVLEALGAAGKRYAVYGSADLNTWTLLREVDAPLGRIYFELEDPVISPYDFARVEEVVE